MTYNDRQEILCQKCTDIALNEPEGEGGVPTLSDPNPKPISSNRSQGTTPEGTERQVQGEGQLIEVQLSVEYKELHEIPITNSIGFTKRLVYGAEFQQWSVQMLCRIGSSFGRS